MIFFVGAGHSASLDARERAYVARPPARIRGGPGGHKTRPYENPVLLDDVAQQVSMGFAVARFMTRFCSTYFRPVCSACFSIAMVSGVWLSAALMELSTWSP